MAAENVLSSKLCPCWGLDLAFLLGCGEERMWWTYEPGNN